MNKKSFGVIVVGLWLCGAGGARGGEETPLVFHFDSGKADGKFGKAIFLGKDKDKDCAHFGAHDLARKNISKLTVEMWVKPALKEFPKGQYQFFVGWWGPSIIFSADANRKLNLWIAGAMLLDKVVPASQITEAGVSYSGPKPLSADWWQDGRWHLVAFAWDTGAGIIRLFFDGEMIGERKGVPFEIIAVPRGYVLGPIGEEDSWLQIDEFRASFRMLDEAEIKRDFEAQTPFKD